MRIEIEYTYYLKHQWDNQFFFPPKLFCNLPLIIARVETPEFLR